MIDNAPPLRSEVTGGLATLACAVCCALPLPTAAGVLTVAGAALLEKTLLAIAAGLAALAMGVWWPHRRRWRLRLNTVRVRHPKGVPPRAL